MRSHARVVIIGGGVIGCRLAYHITQLGWRDVVLIERNELTSGSSWHAAGLCAQYAETLFLARLYKDAFPFYAGLEAETGVPVGIHAVGGVRLARTKDGVEEFKRYLNLARTVGMDAEIIGPNRVRELWPLLESDQFLAALHTRGEGWVDPTQTTNALAKAARDRGAEINRHTRVTGLSQTPSGEWRVETDKGVVTAEYVVNAAGCWGAEISAMLGHYLPVLAKEHQYLVTEPAPELKGLAKELPVLRDYSVPLYARQEGQGLMISGYEHEVKFRWLDGAPKDFANELFSPDLDRAAPCLEQTYQMIPALQNLGIRTVVNGPIPGTPDLMGLVGPAHGLRGYFVCCGVYGGFVQGGVTRYLAEWIIDGEPSVDISEMDVRRFGGFATKDYLVSRLTAGHMWSIPAMYPETEPSGARPVRTSGLYGTLRDKGAVFGVVNGWEVPNWFAPDGVEREDKPSFGRANWFDHVGAECAAVRNKAGIFDASSLAKITVNGPGAEAFLDGLSAHPLPPMGRRAQCAFLGPSGGIVFLAAIDRTAEDRYDLTVHGSAEQGLSDWLLEHAPESGVAIANNTDGEAAVVLAGPKTAAILDAACAAPVSQTKSGAIARTTIGSAAVRIVRTDDIDDSAWEIRCAPSQLLPLYEALWRRGKPLGLADFGRRAHDSLRIERNIPRCGVDFGIETSPAAAALPAPRNGKFVGSDALRAGAPKRDGSRLVRLMIDDGYPTDPWGGEMVEAGGRQVGFVTSGAFGHTMRRSLAFARVAPSHATPGTKLDVVVLGQRYGAAVLGGAQKAAE